MTRRGSETRQKTKTILVRVTESEYARLTSLATDEGATRAEYLRRRLKESRIVSDRHHEDSPDSGLLESDRILLANLTRSMGRLAGLMKLAVLKSSALGRGGAVHSVLDGHHKELQNLQGTIRALLERVR